MNNNIKEEEFIDDDYKELVVGNENSNLFKINTTVNLVLIGLIVLVIILIILVLVLF